MLGPFTTAAPSRGSSPLKRTLAAALLTLSSLVTVPAAANVMITGLDIGGTLFDVTFHDDPASFQSLWDANGDYSFVGGTLGHAPTFWGDQPGAEAAANAIMTYLAFTGTTIGGGDAFIVPYAYDPRLTGANVLVTGDDDSALGIDIFAPQLVADQQFTSYGSLAYPWASFDRAGVPAPVTPALLLAGLIAAGMARRRRRAD